jgi:hypothetical protein
MSQASSEIEVTETSAPTTETPVAEPTKEEKRRAALAKGRATAAANRANKKVAPANSIAAESVEVTGALLTIKDGQNHVWAIPAESHDVVGRHQSAFELKRFKGYDPRFTYEFHHAGDESDITSMLTDEWVPVTRQELGLKALPMQVSAEHGTPTDNYYWVGNSLCMKKPKVLVDRTHKAMDEFRKATMGAMKPVGSENIDPAREKLERGGLVKEEIRVQSTFQEPVALAR